MEESIGVPGGEKAKKTVDKVGVMDGSAGNFISGRKILEPKLEKAEIENMRPVA